MADKLENIKNVMDKVLGEPRREFAGGGGWYEYNCPCCGEDHGGPDNKYNFAVQIDEQNLWGHCWKCGYHGKLSRIIKRYGTTSDMDEYREELTALKESNYYSLTKFSTDVDDVFIDHELELPSGFKLINSEDWFSKFAYKYLIDRGLDDTIIKNFKIGYLGVDQGKLSNRVVIPSYDAYGDLNYWVARDYSGKSYRKILNPDIDKKKITFNEQLINWYEPITLVEGPFDHIVVPNSIPLLGKTIDDECDVYKKIIAKSHNTINIFLDDDATESAYKMYKQLNYVLPDRVRVIECPDGYDASDYFREYGRKGILNLMKTAKKLDDFTLATL